jgi:hypothetical protein
MRTEQIEAAKNSQELVEQVLDETPPPQGPEAELPSEPVQEAKVEPPAPPTPPTPDAGSQGESA